MAKQIRRNYTIDIAPDILGFYENFMPKAFDRRNAKELNPNDMDDKIYIYDRQVNEWFLKRA